MEDSSFLSIPTCVHREHFCPPSTSPQNWGHPSWWGQSKRPHSNLGRCRCVLFGMGSYMAILSTHQESSWPAELCPQNEDSGRQSHRGTRFLCLQLDRCHGNLPLQHPAQGRRLYRLYTIAKHPAATLLSPAIPLPIHAAVPLWHISALGDAFGRFSPGLAYFALHLFRTGWNWSKYM